MISDFTQSMLLLALLISSIVLLGPDYDRTEPSPRIFSFAEYSVENNGGLRSEEPQINTAYGGHEP